MTCKKVLGQTNYVLFGFAFSCFIVYNAVIAHSLTAVLHDLLVRPAAALASAPTVHDCNAHKRACNSTLRH